MQVRVSPPLDLFPRRSLLISLLPHTRSKKKVRCRSVCLPHLHLIPSRSLRCSRNATDSARPAVPVLAPATVNRVLTMRASALPTAIQKLNPMTNLPYPPHITWTGPLDAAEATLSSSPSDSIPPHLLIAKAYAHHR